MLKIFHIADLQIEIRNAGENAQRLEEYRSVLLIKTINEIKLHNPDIVVICGDVYEFESANGDETDLFAEFLHLIKDLVYRVIIINGNHDIKQKHNAIIAKGLKRNNTDFIYSVVNSIKSSKISYYAHTGLYKDDKFDIIWVVWSQLDKWSAQDPKPSYSPWIENSYKNINGASIELFHDPVKNAKNFNGEPNKLFDNYKISFDDFRCNTVLAGDIHAPDIVYNDGKLFTYSSSLIQRNYGEGNYYNDDKLYIGGNYKHGYNIIEFDIEQNKAVSCEFHKILPPVSRHTIYISKDFNYERLEALQIDPIGYNKIRLVVSNIQKYNENQKELIEHFKNNYNCSVDIEMSNDNIEVSVDAGKIDDIEKIIDKDSLLDISKKYIDTIVDKTNTVDKDMKEETKDFIFDIFRKELDKIELISAQKKIEFLYGDVDNFMSLGETSVQFKNNSITKISGTNKVGKTTIYRFIKWIFTDKIDKSQNDRNKKLNYCMYFNDTTNKDHVSGHFVFNLNGDLHKVTKTLIRTWKRGGSKAGQKDWIEHITETPKLSISIESNALTSEDTTECLAYLKTIFSFEELDSTIIVDQNSLDNLINITPEELNNNILKNIGLDFFENLLNVFDDVKDSTMESLTKPTQTIDDILTNKGVQEENIKNYENSIDKIKEKIDSKELELELEDSNKSELLKSLHVIEDDENHPKYEQYTNDKIEDVKESIRKSIEEKTEKEEKLATLESLEKLNETKILLNSTKEDLIYEQSEVSRKLEIDQNKLISSKESLKQIVTIIKNDLEKELNYLKTKLSNKESEVSTLNHNIETNISNYKTHINNIINSNTEEFYKLKEKIQTEKDSITSINSKKSIKDSEEKANSNRIKEINTNIETLSGSKNCPTCDRPKSEETIISLNNKIEEFNIELKKKEESNISISEEIKAFEKSIEIHENLITEITKDALVIKNIVKEYKESLDVLSEKLCKEYFDRNKELEESIVNINEEIVNINEEITKEQENLKSKIKQDSRYLDNVDKITNINENIETYNALSTSLETKIESNAVLIETNDVKIKEVEDLTKFIKDFNTKTLDDELEKHEKILESIEKNKIKVEKNKETENKITKVNEEIVKLKNEIKDFNKSLAELKNDIKISENEIISGLNDIENIKKYKLAESSVKLYKKIINKNGLPQFVFAHIIPIINSELNSLLVDVDFRLQFEIKSNSLLFHDLVKNVSRPVSFISGMESTLSSLSILYILKKLNISNSVNGLFIDEISGKLNDGKELSYEAKNYQDITSKFIQKLSSYCPIYIIDHVLELNEQRILEVQPNINGNKIIEIKI